MSSNTSSSHASPKSKLGLDIELIAIPLRDVLGGLIPENVPLSWAEEILDAFIDLEKLAASGRVLIAARAAESNAWRRAGSPSPAAWLALKQGTDTGRAKADLDTSARLGDLPETADEMRAGNLSTQQAGAVADGATVNPGAERALLDTAKADSLKHTREEAARRKAEVEDERSKVEREARVHRERRARWWTRDGAWNLFLTGPLSTGAEMQQTLENRVGDIHRTRRGGCREERDQYAYDAALDLICQQPADTTDDTDTDEGAPEPKRRRRKRVPVKRLMLVRVDLTALANGFVGGGEVCEIPGIGPVSVTEARRLFGDSVLRLITTNDTAVVDVVNPSRQLTAAQQIAKLWTDPKCCVAGCNRTVRLEYEHRDDYARSGQTVLVDLEHMCKHDHDLKTLHNWQLVAGTGRRAFVPPTDPRHPHHAGPDIQPATDVIQVTLVTQVTDLTARVARIDRIRAAAERRAARVRGQGDLFGDTG